MKHYILLLCLMSTQVSAMAAPIKKLQSLSALKELKFYGSCDASGAVALSDKLFAVADDEDNVIRVYDAQTGGAPVLQHDLSYENGLKKSMDSFGRPLPAPMDELDIEAATELGGEAYWVTSHGRDSKGRLAPDRLRFFATSIELEQGDIRLTSPAVTDLLQILASDSAMKPFKLLDAAGKAPKEPGGLALEGMTARPEGGLLFGFRSPVPEGKALMVTLKNPKQLLSGQRARLGPAVLVDLNGRGVRGLSYWRGQYLIAAGDPGEAFDPALYRWFGEADEATQIQLDLPKGFNIEAFFTPEGLDRFMLLSDDGGRSINGKKACKKLKNANEKYFRGLWVG